MARLQWPFNSPRPIISLCFSRKFAPATIGGRSRERGAAGALFRIISRESCDVGGVGGGVGSRRSRL